jgi:menaquinone-9 beta-reductase
MTCDVAIIGAGPAGSAAAITAARLGLSVVLLERGRYPRHKVCGEFVSPESLSILQMLLGPDDLLRNAIRIGRARFYLQGSTLDARIEPAAATVARRDLDDALWNAAIAAGVMAIESSEVLSVDQSSSFTVRTRDCEYRAPTVIIACGRWSRLVPHPTPPEKWIGLKAHFASGKVCEPMTELFVFRGGYCGVQPVRSDGQDCMNVSALVKADVARTLAALFEVDAALRERTGAWQQVTETFTTSPIAFVTPRTSREGKLLAGDAAGFIDPFVGDGIAIALRSGAMAAEAAALVCSGGAPLNDAVATYEAQYRRAFLPAFRNAARVRRLAALPMFAQKTAVAALSALGAGELMLKATRSR